MQKIVLDTNVIVSALIGSGYPAKYYITWFLKRR
jgi:predicted nucleic acid-binding protein